jgi:hypothetical protein
LLPLFLSVIEDTLATDAVASFVSIDVAWCEFVAPNAMGLGCLSCGERVAPENVGPMVYRFEVGWVNARPIPTKVIYLFAGRDWANEEAVHEAVNVGVSQV